MAEIKKTALFGKLTPATYKTLEAAVVACKLRGNPYVEIAHWVDQLLRQADMDAALIARAFDLRPERLAVDSTAALDKLPRGATSISSFSSHITEALEQGFLWGAVYFDAPRIRSGHLLLGMLKSDALREILVRISPEFDKISGDRLAEEFAKIVASSSESAVAAAAAGAGAAPGEASGAIPPAEMDKEEGLRRFTSDLTDKARRGQIDPIVGRDEEIRQCVDILMRRRQNNPILVGEAGVGKTAVVEGFVHRILAGAVPPGLQHVRVRALDVGLLQAGASMKGEFEQRLRSVVDEVEAAWFKNKPVILFIDEAHTLIGAGGAAGTGDAANLLKPALARGTLRTIAATTWDEYKRHIEKDPALSRRFQVVKVDEPSEDRCIRMMRAVAGPFEKHHKVGLLDEAINAAVRLSHRYLAGRQLPDKAVSLIDTASARVAVSQHAVPPEVDDCRRRIEALEVELAILDREIAIGFDHQVRFQEINGTLAREKDALAGLEQHWDEERKMVAKILTLRSQLQRRADGTLVPAASSTAAIHPAQTSAAVATPPQPGGAALSPVVAAEPPSGSSAGSPPASAASVPAAVSAPSGNGQLTQAERDKLLAELKALQDNLRTFQGETPLVFPSVDANAIASVVADWTGIPIGRMVKNEIEQILALANVLERRVVGQRHALDMIARRIRVNRARLDNPTRPVGVFMLAGPSGTGKTETALTLADAVYGGEESMIALNMTEYTQDFTVSKIMGPPPGYVGHEDGGILTNFVQKRPYCLILLDEFEKAHPDAHRLFMQVFDKGHLEDGKGKDTDFRNTIIILTTNAAQDVIVNLCKDPELMPDAEGLEQAMREPLKAVFPDALLNRLVVVPFYPISKEVLLRIIRLQLSRVETRVRDNHKVPFTFDESVPDLIAQRCTELERGARMIETLITNTILPEIGGEVLARLAAGSEIKRVHVGVKDGGFSFVYD
jgi:type VI secretion system protein VasG